MAGNTKRIQVALESVMARVLCEFGIQDGTHGYRRVQVTGAIILGALEGQEERIADLEAENARLGFERDDARAMLETAIAHLSRCPEHETTPTTRCPVCSAAELTDLEQHITERLPYAADAETTHEVASASECVDYAAGELAKLRAAIHTTSPDIHTTPTEGRGESSDD